MPRMSNRKNSSQAGEKGIRPEATGEEGAAVEHRSAVLLARRVATLGLLGAVVGGAVPAAVSIGAATLTAEGAGLAIGLFAGLLLTAKHLL